MKVFLLLIFMPILIAGDTLCPNSKTTCPEDKQCCEVDGEYSCCDPDDDQDTPAIRMKVVPGVEIMSSAMFVNASLSTDESTLQFGLTWCDDNRFCLSGYTTCCESWCCKTGYRCGSSYFSCRSRGTIISPEIIILIFLAASVLASRRL